MSTLTISPEATAEEAAEILNGRIAENRAPAAIVTGDARPLAKRLQEDGHSVTVLDSEGLARQDRDLVRRPRRDQWFILVQRPSDSEIARRLGLV